MSDHLPLEVFIEILLRLPLKTLVQCTCVCKSWNFVITNPNFITTHLNRTTVSNNNTTTTTDLLLLRQYSENHKKERYSLRRDNETLDECAELEFPFETLGKRFFRIVGSCNGLLCLSDDLSGYTNVIILWNPSIRKCVTLPRPRVTFKTHGPFMSVLGFGFDVKSNDYKVVRIAYLQENDRYDIVPPEVEIYSLSTGAWRDISAVRPRYSIPERFWSQAFMNGAVHWLAYDQRRVDNNRILTFDMGDEVFREMMLPTSLACERVFSIAVLQELLSVFQPDRHSWYNCCSIWVMKEYGVAESWTKQFSIDIQEGVGKTIGLRKNGEILQATRDGKLVLYHTETHRIKDLGIRGNGDSFYVDTYMESLVLVKGVNGVLGVQIESSDAVTCKETPVLRGENDVVEITETVKGGI